MRIHVSGAGPAGLIAAYWLDRNGKDVVLAGRTDHLRLDGYGLDFFGTRFDVADRLPDSRGNVLGYRVAGTVGPNDIAMIRLDVETALRDHDDVNIVCVFDDFEHVTAKGLLADIRFDRSYAKRIRKFAIVGDSVRAKAFAIAAKPFGEYDAQHFSLESIDDAWMWAAAGY